MGLNHYYGKDSRQPLFVKGGRHRILGELKKGMYEGTEGVFQTQSDLSSSSLKIQLRYHVRSINLAQFGQLA